MRSSRCLYTAEVPEGIEVHKGDFLLTRSNTRSLVGDVCVVESIRSKTILCDLIYRLRVYENSPLSRFLMYLLMSSIGRVQIESDARGSSHTMVKISQGHIKGHIKRWRVLLPPLNEQARIVEDLDRESGEIGSAASRIEHEIDLLREYRARLIADVVTGKLDVRGVIEAGNGPSSSSGPYPGLPDETEELDDLDTGADAEAEIIDTEETTWNDM